MCNIVSSIPAGSPNEADILKSAIHEAYGMDFVNARRVLKTKFKRKNKDGLTLADRIRMNRYGNGVSMMSVMWRLE